MTKIICENIHRCLKSRSISLIWRVSILGQMVVLKLFILPFFFSKWYKVCQKNPICSILYVHFTLHISAVFISTWILPFLQDFDSTYQIWVEIRCTLWIWEISILSLKPTKVRPIYCCCAIFDKLWERLIVLSTKKTKQKLEEEKKMPVIPHILYRKTNKTK